MWRARRIWGDQGRSDNKLHALQKNHTSRWGEDRVPGIFLVPPRKKKAPETQVLGAGATRTGAWLRGGRVGVAPIQTLNHGRG